MCRTRLCVATNCISESLCSKGPIGQGASWQQQHLPVSHPAWADGWQPLTKLFCFLPGHSLDAAFLAACLAGSVASWRTTLTAIDGTTHRMGKLVWANLTQSANNPLTVPFLIPFSRNQSSAVHRHEKSGQSTLVLRCSAPRSLLWHHASRTLKNKFRRWHNSQKTKTQTPESVPTHVPYKTKLH